MAYVSNVLEKKGSEIQTIGRHASVLDAAVLMNDQRIGALVVTEDRRVVGIFTERDVLQQVVAERRDPAETKVGDLMTTDVVCVTNRTKLEEARAIMKQRRIRHLPVVGEEGELLGVISIGDLNAWDLDGQEQTIHYMREYMHGRA